MILEWIWWLPIIYTMAHMLLAWLEKALKVTIALIEALLNSDDKGSTFRQA